MSNINISKGELQIELLERSKELFKKEIFNEMLNFTNLYTEYAFKTKLIRIYETCVVANVSKETKRKLFSEIAHGLNMDYITNTKNFVNVLTESISKDNSDALIDKAWESITENGEFSFHEWPELGSQFDLISLEIYAYFGIICDVGFMGPTLLKFKNKERKTFEEHMSEDASWLIRDKKKLLKEINSQHLLYRDYLFYLLDLIINCTNFIFSHGKTNIGVDDGFNVYSKVLEIAKSRLFLDVNLDIHADEMAALSGLNIRTISNNKLIQPKKENQQFGVVLYKDAVNFLEKGLRPDGTYTLRDRKRNPFIYELKKQYYASLWKQQLEHSIVIENDLDSGIFLKELNF